MSNQKCYYPLKGLDDVLAKKLDLPIADVAGYRNLYEEQTGETISADDSDKLSSFIGKLNREDKREALRRAKLVRASREAVIYKHLSKVFSPYVLERRVSMISEMFSSLITDYTDENPDYTRKQVIEEVGFGNLIAEAKEYIDGFYRTALEKNDLHKITEFKKIVDNWDALVYMAQSNIRRYEDVVLGQDFDFVAEATEDNYNDNDTSVIFNIEESVREHWLTNHDFVSAFGSIGKEVRKAISRVAKTSKDGLERDDLDIPINLTPNKVHSILMEVLRGAVNSDHMLAMLEDYASDNTWIAALVEQLHSDPVLKTQFFVDFYKNFQIYSAQFTKDGKVNNSLLNKAKGYTLYTKYKASVLVGKTSKDSVFIKAGNFIKLNKDAVENFKAKVKGLFEIDSKAWDEYNEKIKEYNAGTNLFDKRPKKPTLAFYDKSVEEQIITLGNLLSTLSIEVDYDLLTAILKNKKDSSYLFKNLKELAQYGLNITDYSIEGSAILNGENFSEKVEKIFSVIAKYNNGLAMDSRVRFNGNTYYSNVTPSYMGDFFNYIYSYVNKNDVEGLQDFLSNKFLTCDTFMYEGKILNKWIEELFNGDLQDENSFAANLMWHKGLAVDGTMFEDLSANKHIKYLISEYLSQREIKGNPNIEYISEEDFKKLSSDKRDKSKIYYIENTNKAYKYNKPNWTEVTKDDYANYPVFILGDANVAKFIKARRYSFNEIVDSLYNTYISERRRQVNSKELEKTWNEQKVSPNENLIKNKDRFTLLPFLNKDYADGKYYNIANMKNPTIDSIKNAIREYLKDEANTFEQNLIKKGIVEKDKTEILHDYFFNTYHATLQQLQMMTIDVAFYDNIKDLQKRYKEIHAPGSKLDITAVDKWSKNRVSDGIERCIYFNDDKVDADESDPDFMEAIRHHFGNDWRTEQYKKNNRTDGQGYRTLSSYRKVLIMSGKWDESYEDAYQTLLTIKSNMSKENRDIPTEEEMKALENIKVVFQPLKPYLFGFESVNGSNQKIPVQHKCAEVVIIPELLPKDSKLRQMAEYMVSNNIDVAYATSVVKVGNYGAVNLKGDVNNVLGEAVVHELNYGDYRIQTNVPEHTYQSRLFGTQFRKLILSNLKREDYSDYTQGNMVKILESEGMVNLSKYNLVRFYNSLVVANILEAYDKFKEIAGNNYKLSSSAIYQIINNDREIRDNIFAMSVDEFGEFVLPLFEGGIEHDAAAMLFSIYKNIVNKQKILGGSAVQASDFGIKGSKENSNLRYVTNKDKTNILYAECEIPFNFAYTDANGNQVNLKFTDYCNPDGTFKAGSKEGTTKIEEEFPGMLDIIAYRIPTERAYSMMNLKVVRCSHPLAGGTIKVPAQGVTIAGFDFDVDKLYFMRKEFRQSTKEKIKLNDSEKGEVWEYIYEEYPDIKAALVQARIDDGYSEDDPIKPALNSYWDSTTLPLFYDKNELFNDAIEDLEISLSSSRIKWDNYDYNKSPFEQSVTARNNMIIELSRQRLMDEETFGERYTPGGFRNSSQTARTMRGLEFSDNSAHVHGNEADFKAIKNGINFSDKSSDPEPNYDPCNPTTIITYNQQNQVAGKLIGIFANQNTHHAFISSILKCELDIPIAFGSYPNGLKDLLNAPDGVDTSLGMAELLAASVDAVKDPVLNFLNLNTLTADSGALLVRLGYSFDDIGLLFNQPAIRRLCEYCFDNSIRNIDEAIRVVAGEYGSNNIDKVVPNARELSQDKMAYNIIAKSKGLEVDKKVQLQALRLFMNIQRASSELSQFILNTKFTAANSVSSTFGAAYEKQQKAYAFINSRNSETALNIVVNRHGSPIISMEHPKLGSDDYLRKLLVSPLAYEQAMLDANVESLNQFAKLTPYETKGYRGARALLASFTKNGSINAKTIDSIHRELPVYILQNDENSLLNPNSIYDKGITMREFYLNIFPEVLASAIANDKTLKEMDLFKYVGISLEKNSTTGEDRFYIVPQDIGGLNSTQVNSIRQELNTLWQDDRTKYIVDGLFNYSFFNVGFNFNHNSFINLFPTEFKATYVVARDYNGKDITYAEYLKSIKEHRGNNIDALDFAIKYCLNHTSNTDLVYHLKGKVLNMVKAIATENGKLKDEFTISSSNLGNRINNFIIGGLGDKLFFRPFIVVDDVVYMANNPLLFNQGEGIMSYRKVEPLGDGVGKLNYNAPTELGRDIDPKKEDAPKMIPEVELSIDEGFELMVDKFLQDVKQRGLAEGDYLTVEEADNNIAAIKETIMAQVMTEEEKIEEIKKRAPELVKNLRDSQGNRVCG